MIKKGLVILALILVAQWLPAQGTNAGACAPLMLYTYGAGSVSPYQCGQILQTGQLYTVSAIPNRGARFHFWRQVKVTAAVKTIIYPSGAIVSSTNTVITPTAIRSREATMKFNLGAATVQVQDDNPGTTTTTKSLGWEAYFIQDTR